MDEDEIQRAVDIGVANKRVIELVQNWCAHATCEKYGGTGLVEIQTGLPIGMRRFYCPHASAAGMAGMQLDFVALDFYDRNCSGCQKRHPVRLPNISELLAERDRARRQATEADTRAADDRAIALKERTARREALSQGLDPATSGILGLIEQLDLEPGEHNSRMLSETVLATPTRFGGNVIEALFDLCETEQCKADPALAALATVGADGERLCRAALALLARGVRSTIAGEIVAKNLEETHSDLVTAALTFVIGLAMPVHGFDYEDELPASPEALRRVYCLFPDTMLYGVQNLLRNPAKHLRIAVANAVLEVLEIDSSFGLKVMDGLIASLTLPDDLYGRYGSARGWAAKALARIMRDHPRDVDERIQREINLADEEKIESLFDVYERVFRWGEGDDQNRTPEITGAHELAYGRMVEVVALRTRGRRLSKAIWFLRGPAKRYPDLLERYAESLLGASALIASELDAPTSPLLDIGGPPNLLRAMEMQSERQSLFFALGAAMEAVAAGALHNPKGVAVSIVRTYDSLDDRHERFKAALVRCLGAVAADPRGLAYALPPIYDAMTSQSILVRGEAASAYARIAQESPDDLPPLLHEGFILLLGDPYVFVHSQALEAIRHVSVPEPYVSRVRDIVLRLAAAHGADRKHEDVLVKCIAAALSLLRDEGNGPGRTMIIALINRLSVRSAAALIREESYLLRGESGLGTVLVRTLRDPDTDEYLAGICLSELRHVPATEIALEAANLRQAEADWTREEDMTDEVLDLLCGIGLWSAAVDVARDATERLTDTRWDRPSKIKSRLRQLAAEIEEAVARGDAGAIERLSREWLLLEREIEDNHARAETQQ